VQDLKNDISTEFIDKIWDNFTENNYIKAIPVKRKKRLAVLLRLLKEFEKGKVYEEKELNDIILKFHEDYCFIRREMICEHLMERENGKY
jgi:hypothetical protein